MAAEIITFVTRSEQLRLRGWRNYSRYMLIVKGFVAGDSFERAQWQKEYAEDARRDAEWKRRHGPVARVATVLPFSMERFTERPPAASSKDVRRVPMLDETVIAPGT